MVQKKLSFGELFNQYSSGVNGEYIIVDYNVKPSTVVGTARLKVHEGIYIKPEGGQEFFIPDKILTSKFRENYERLSFESAIQSGFKCRPGASKEEFKEASYWLEHMDISYLDMEWEVFKE